MRPKLEAMTDDELLREKARLLLLLDEHVPLVLDGRDEYYNIADVNLWEARLHTIDELLADLPARARDEDRRRSGAL